VVTPAIDLPDSATPTLSVQDPRGLTVCSVSYCRQKAGAPSETRTTRHQYNEAARLVSNWDPRLWALAAKPNLSTLYNLAGEPVLTDSVDAGWQVTLFNEAGSAVCAWDGRGAEQRTEYDSLQRVTAIHERSGDGVLRTVERFFYGDASSSHNQCGQLIRHDDPASSLVVMDYGLLTVPIAQAKRVLNSLDIPDWPQDLQSRDALLEDQTYVTGQVYNPLGELLAQRDAMGNLGTFTQTVSGQPKAVVLTLTGVGSAPKRLVSDIRYNAFGQVERETAGNGVVTQAHYAEEDGRLRRLWATADFGERLQDLNYHYDPVGNILSVEDQAQAISYFNNRKIEPINRYRYDSLYQLIEARGREVLTPGYGPQLPLLQPMSLYPSQLREYTQTFDYDAAGNLLVRHHSGAPTFRMATSSISNRSLAQRNDGSLPGECEIGLGFDANGNQQQLQPGQQMSWDARNQLSRVTQVVREDGPDDDEHYRYDRLGHRLRKVRLRQTRSRTLRSEVRYLPGLEIHNDNAKGEEHHVISLQAGRNSVRVLHWASQPPGGLANDQLRYSLTDHLGSCTVELDEQASLISQEWYYPFGGTACWAGRNSVEANYKTVRYSGKERDATGLYYYGYRYYAPWLQRWVNPDPAHEGLNAFQMVDNNPINLFDREGLAGEPATQRWKMAYRGVRAQGVRVRTLARGIIAVDISGGNELFNRMGFGLERDIRGDRALSYLSIDESLRGKIAGGKRMVNLNRAEGADIKSAAKLKSAGAVAYINGGFFNMEYDVDDDKPEYASVGTNVIDGKRRESVGIPQSYQSFYEKVRMSDRSMIHAAPPLSSGGRATFTEAMLEDERFQFSKINNTPGKLVHAEHPNARSGMSRPQESGTGSRTRLAMGSSDGRGANASGYTMPEWARVMARLDRLNSSESSSINLDGGQSTSLGVIGSRGESLMARSFPGQLDKEIGNFIAFSKPVGFFRGLFKR